MNEFNFGENLRIVRQAKGISQEIMALGLNMSQGNYSKLERRPTIPELGLVERIAKVVDEDPSLLLSGRSVEDLIPKIGFEQQTKEIMNTRIGVVFFWMLIIPYINAAYDMGDGFCRGLGTSEETKVIVRFSAGLLAMFIAGYWLKRIQKK